MVVTGVRPVERSVYKAQNLQRRPEGIHQVAEVEIPRLFQPSERTAQGAWNTEKMAAISCEDGEVYVVPNSGPYSLGTVKKYYILRASNINKKTETVYKKSPSGGKNIRKCNSNNVHLKKNHLISLLVATEHEASSFEELPPSVAATTLKTLALLLKENPKLMMGGNCSLALRKAFTKFEIVNINIPKVAQSIEDFHLQVWNSSTPTGYLPEAPSDLKDLINGSPYTLAWSEQLIKALNLETSDRSLTTRVEASEHGVKIIFNKSFTDLCQTNLEDLTAFIQSTIANINSYLEKRIEAEVQTQSKSSKKIDLNKIMTLGSQFAFSINEDGIFISPVYTNGGIFEAFSRVVLKRTNSQKIELSFFDNFVRGLASSMQVLRKSVTPVSFNEQCLQGYIKAYPEAFSQLAEIYQEEIETVRQLPQDTTRLQRLENCLSLAKGGLTAQNLS